MQIHTTAALDHLCLVREQQNEQQIDHTESLSHRCVKKARNRGAATEELQTL